MEKKLFLLFLDRKTTELKKSQKNTPGTEEDIDQYFDRLRAA